MHCLKFPPGGLPVFVFPAYSLLLYPPSSNALWTRPSSGSKAFPHSSKSLPSVIIDFRSTAQGKTAGWQIVPTYDGLIYDIPSLRWCNHTWNFELWSFPRLGICGTMLSCDAGQKKLPVSQVITRANNPYTVHVQPFCTQTAMLFVTFSTVLSQWHGLVDTLL